VTKATTFHRFFGRFDMSSIGLRKGFLW